MPSKIVHIINNEKFINSFIELINANFDTQDHLFINISNYKANEFPLPKLANVIEFEQDLNLTRNFFLLWKKVTPYLIKADKIIVHGAFTGNFNKYLFLKPKLLAKSYWVMWGGDLYQPLMKQAKTLKQNIHFAIDKYIKGRFAGYVTYLPGDYKVAQELYNAKTAYFECIMYPSNLYKELTLPNVHTDNKFILVGNSGDPTNNHQSVFETLSKLEDQSFSIICPLSYGNKSYIEQVKTVGKSMFSSRFIPLTNFITLDEYMKILAKVDIAIFAHNRQQAMGNIISLLGLGKKLYMRNDITPFDLFNSLRVKVFDIQNIKLESISIKDATHNIKKIEDYFCEAKLIQQLKVIFEG
ncbi:TDP-N-acetylfucosamine:lipid II N-acetylfucosaminyltransferase [Colwellia sp. Bg11-12]|uniref:TDP-N-acetylfucosamine:lipid II N-acetylfucosaminyltransferase n=1 Tax=Colwellia sp. Bg11-12 TaxID=2759817 RepID=UPI0015F4E93B|nr:TDP-N-acetylfucosamine:lipid II N-acetylfucosaminyltransferase [Colwellia sp. Bg11-12]MBA6264794.1 TDP-N-acetylfucosamine:lipid II N-acetylfucosaminyltransferase [Colwellia sp. Bg11-12]